MSTTILDHKQACADLIISWGLYRDQSRWDELLSTFHPDGEIAVSWFRGPFADFVAHCRHGGRSKHLIMAPFVRVNGARAIGETSVTILVRQDMQGLAVDLTSRARFLDRIEQRDGVWRIRERIAIYEQDRLDPVVPSDAFDRAMQAADTARFPEPFRHMAFRLLDAGRSLAEPLHHDGSAPTREARECYEAWLAGA